MTSGLTVHGIILCIDRVTCGDPQFANGGALQLRFERNSKSPSLEPFFWGKVGMVSQSEPAARFT